MTSSVVPFSDEYEGLASFLGIPDDVVRARDTAYGDARPPWICVDSGTITGVGTLSTRPDDRSFLSAQAGDPGRFRLLVRAATHPREILSVGSTPLGLA